MPEKPWATGPAELLRHALSLLATDTDSNRRIAMILLDNAVEQAAKTFLSLPKRVTGVAISRKRLAEIGESFPALIDALEEFASNLIEGLDLGAIEWYHRLRNELYHQGFGLTVEREKVEVYAEFAQVLYRCLFGVELTRDSSVEADRLGEFMRLWHRLEEQVAAYYQVLDAPANQGGALRTLQGSMLLSSVEKDRLSEFRQIRNGIVHGQPGSKKLLTERRLRRLAELLETVERDFALYNAVEASSLGPGDSVIKE